MRATARGRRVMLTAGMLLAAGLGYASGPLVVTDEGIDTWQEQTPPAETPAPSPAPDPVPTPATLPGDDNGDGRIDEDESGWDCRTMGNATCGVEVNGTWYLLDFTTGTFSPRP